MFPMLYRCRTRAIGVLVLLALWLPVSSAWGTSQFDVYGGYRKLRSTAQAFYTGTNTHLKAHRLVDVRANFPPNGLVGQYLHPTTARHFTPVTRRTRYLEVLRYRIIKNTRTEIFTAPEDGNLTQYAKTGDAYKTSGFFTVEKVGKRWWYMTPEGSSFISLSVSVVTPAARDGKDKDGKTYADYVKAKYGEESTYRANWANATIDRLQRWGFNTIGTFSHQVQTKAYLTKRLPHAMTLRLSNKVVLHKAVGNLWENIAGGVFPDVWHPEFETHLDARMKRLTSPESVRDPYVIYLFPDQADELRGIGAKHLSLGWAALAGKTTISGHTNYSKLKLRDMMRQKYQDIQRLNAAWQTTYTTWHSDGGYPHGKGFLDQGKRGIPGGRYNILSREATPAMQNDLHTFTIQLLKRYAKTVTSTIRKYDKNHLIATPNGVTLPLAIQAFDGYFDVFFSSTEGGYNLLQTKRPFGSSVGYLSAEQDSPLRLEGWLAPKTELIQVNTTWGKRNHLKVWVPNQDFWFDLKRGYPLRISLFDERQHMLDFGHSPGNQYDILQTGNDTTGGWMVLRSRGYHSGSVEEIAWWLSGQQKPAYCRFASDQKAVTTTSDRIRETVSAIQQWIVDRVCRSVPGTSVSNKIYFRRRGYGNIGTGGFDHGYATQADRAKAWEAKLHRGLSERADNGDYFRIGANWWKFSDNGWTYWLERYNFGLVTMKDNAYDGREATTQGADGRPGTPDDEAADYGDFLTGVMRTNTELYTFIQRQRPIASSQP